MSYGPETRLSIRQDIMVQAIDDELIVLDTAENQYFGLNESGRCIWKILADGGSVADATAAVCTDYSVTTDQAERDVIGLVKRLIDTQLATIK
ncbi:PqqD family protein [Gammaproteobacteria bacterium]|nr:PqqD family protein [Gammaproteobacteria bacterium]